jgi:putative Holliday junction resolvase
VAVETWDERFSTAEAEGYMRSMGRKPSREKGASDAVSAAVILQGWLDRRRGG